MLCTKPSFSIKDDNKDGEMDTNVSILIITYNEDVNIERCIDSVRWSNDVVIIDSFSRDRTIELARTYTNVSIFQNEFADFSSQRNFGLHKVSYRNPWVLVLDADEVVEPDLATEIMAIAQCGRTETRSVFLVRRWVIFEGKVLRWNTTSDFWIERLMRPEVVTYEGAVHEKVRFFGPPGQLQGRLKHYQFSKGIKDWLNRRANYAMLETRAQSADSYKPSLVDFFSSDVMRRRASIKFVFQRMPLRWLVYFFFNFVFRLSYLDGISGLKYIFLESLSQYRGTRQAKGK
jgi:glycosyltransferase involved in cell wall biosynthesis